MIFFVPGYDPATESNLAVAEQIVHEGSHPLLGSRATRAELVAMLTREAVPLFAMAHGRSDRVLAQGGETALAESDMPVLGKRLVFTYACHTATALGEMAAKNGAVWWGYTGAVTAPDSSAEFLPFFVEIFSYIRDAFPNASSRVELARILGRLAELCWSAEQRMTDLLSENPDLNVVPAYLCLSHIWQRLRVWGPGEGFPLMHPEASIPIFLP